MATPFKHAVTHIPGENRAILQTYLDRINAASKSDLKASKAMKVEDISQLQIITGKFWNLFHHAI